MYSVAVNRDFVAQHFLFGGDWGKENRPHSHSFRVEIRLEGEQLDRHGYLTDIVDIEKNLDQQVNYFQDQLLNDLPEFSGLNPSVEHFSRIICERFLQNLQNRGLAAVTVKLWENREAWAAFRMEIKG
ncbi:MAG: 6-carboxytetrahydropterin synthase [Calditrichia bacterium]